MDVQQVALLRRFSLPVDVCTYSVRQKTNTQERRDGERDSRWSRVNKAEHNMFIMRKLRPTSWSGC